MSMTERQIELPQIDAFMYGRQVTTISVSYIPSG